MLHRQKPAVLIVEDDAEARSALAIRLTHAGFEVTTVPDGPAALTAVHRRRPDAALLDVRMPAMDGFEVCERIRAIPECRDIPIFFLTGTTDGLVRNNLGKLTATVGGDFYLTKPYDGKIVTMMLWDAVNRSQNPAPTAA